jgi:hypothetical protein
MASLTGHTIATTYGDVLQLGNAGAGVVAIPKQLQDGLGNNTGLSVGTGWIASAVAGNGTARLTTSPTNATVTPVNLTDLTMNLLANRKYFGEVVIFANNSTGAEGLAFTFAGTVGVTSVEFGFLATPPGATLGTVTSTALATPITVTVVSTSDACYSIAFGIVVSTAGTLIPAFAEVSHATGTATAKLNSYFWLDDSPN